MTSQQVVKVIGAQRDVRELVTSFWTGLSVNVITSAFSECSWYVTSYLNKGN